MTDATGKPRIWLWVSLALNMLLIGAILGGLAYRAHAPAPPPQDASASRLAPRGFAAALPPEHRAAYRQAARQALRAAREDIRAVREARRDVAELVRADPFDRQALEQALGRLRTAQGVVEARSQTVVIDVLADMTVEERRVVADQWMRPRERGADRGARPAREDRPPIPDGGADPP